MTTIRITTAAIVSGLLIAVSGTAGWSAGNSDSAAPVVQTAPGATGSTQLEVLIPVLKNPNPEHRDTLKNCKSSSMYSSHDVVGDPETCFMGRLGTRVMPAGFAGGGGL